jgi:hypothetical protein
MTAWGTGTAVALVVAIALLGTIPAVAALAPAASGAPSVPVLSASTSPAAVTTAAPLPPVFHCPPPPYPNFVQLPGGFWPLDPSFAYQGPCHLVQVDEVHGSFASGANESADRWTIPWTLPAQGSAGQQNVEEGLYTGMVVTGDPNSLWNQSYLEVLASPAVNSSQDLIWDLNLTVISFVNASTFDPAGCPAYALNLSWNGTFYCEFNDFAHGESVALYAGLTGGQALSVTFNGTYGAKSGMWISLAGTGLTPTTVHLNASTTGTYGFEPAFPAACASDCFLTWAQSFGLGVGVDICPWFTTAYAYCDSYNGTAYPTLPPVTWGIPQFWNATSHTYVGDYRYFQPESVSGVCNANPPAGVTVGGCQEFLSAGGDGFYPYFSLTATGLDFGTTYPSSVTSWGGPYEQYLDTPGVQDLVPLALTQLTDSSLAGYLAPNDPLNLTFNVTDLGTIAGASVAWSLNGSAWTTDNLTGVGTASAAAYSDTIPAGANGPILYQVNVTNDAGITVSSAVHRVLRGPLPTFFVTVLIDPANCGSVLLGGVPYLNGSAAHLLPGMVSLAATGCYPYNFTGYATSPALMLGPGGGGTLTVTGNGTLMASFVYVRPTEAVQITLTPSGCGEVTIDGTAYTNGTVADLLYSLPHAINATVLCGGYAFGGWTTGPNVTVLDDAIVALNNGTLSATFVPLSETSPIYFATNPATCGGVGLGGAGYGGGESVNVFVGTYTLTPEPCRHFGFLNFTASGGANVSGTTLTVSGTGNVLENNFALTEVFVVTNPGYCGGITIDGTSYTNGSYVPVSNHSAYTVTASTCAGHYLDGFSASGGLTLEGSLLTVNGSGELLVVSLPGTPSIFVGFVTEPGDCGAIDLNGNDYANGAFVSLVPGTSASITALPCDGYGNVAWSLSGDIQIVGSTVFLNGSGAITAVFGALVPILIQTVPSNCGSVVIDGGAYTNGATPTLINGRVYSIVGSPCAHYELSTFESSPYVAIQNNSIAPDGPSTITAVFVPIPYTVATTVFGPGCGAVALGGAPANNGTLFNLTAGNYTLTATPCGTSEFTGFNVSANLSIAAGHLFVNGSGTVTATFVPIPPAVSLGGSTDAFVGGTALFYAAVQVPVAASGYTYVWTFGDGATNTTTGNTTTHTYTHVGTYTVAVEVIDPYHHYANATLSVTVAAQSSTNYSGSLTTALVVLGLAAVVLLIVVLVGRRRAPPPAEAPVETPPTPPPPPPERPLFD